MAESWQDLWNEHNKVTVDGVEYTPQELEKSNYRTGEDLDDYTFYTKKLEKAAGTQAPKVSVSNGKIKISAPQAILDSNITQQLKSELSVLKGADLESPNIQDAINKINDELRTNFATSAITSTLGWTEDEYKDYQYAVQTVNTTNPLASSNVIKGTDKDGNVVAKTPKDWVAYWQQATNVDERNDLFDKSLQSNNPYERTMALVLGAGGKTPVYGFSLGDKVGQFFGRAGNQLKKFPEGATRTLGSSFNFKRIEQEANKLGVKPESLSKMLVRNEDEFNKKKESLKGKTWNQLSDDDKAFILTLAVSKENKSESPSMRGMIKRTPGYYYAQDIERMSSDNEANSRYAINSILLNNSYDKYKEARDECETIYNYDENNNEDDIRFAKNADWAGIAGGAGDFTGAVGRILWEAAVMRGLSGGINPKSITNPKLITGAEAQALTSGGIRINSISDKIGEKLVSGLSKIGVSPASKFGQSAMQFTANLIGTVPEDLLQTSLDNVLTANPEANKDLLNWDNMSENFKQNLIWMSIFNAGKAGLNAVKKYKMMKQLEKMADLDQELDIDIESGKKLNVDGMGADGDDIRRAYDNGGRLEIGDDGVVKVVDADGVEKILKNTTAEQAELARKVMEGSDSTVAPKVSPEEIVAKAMGDSEIVNNAKAYKVENSAANSAIKFYGLGGNTKIKTSDYMKANGISKKSDIPTAAKSFLSDKGRTMADIADGVKAASDINVTAENINSAVNAYVKAVSEPLTANDMVRYLETHPEESEVVQASIEKVNEEVKTEHPVEAPAVESSASTLQERLLQKSKEIYDKRVASANKLKDEGMKQSLLKRAGMEKAARDRLITGELTGKERQALSDRYNKFFRGKDVIVNGQHAVVIEPSVFGRVKVKFDDGTTKIVDPVDAEAQFTIKEDIDKDIFNKFIKKDIEQQLGVNLDEMSAEADTAPVQPWDNDEVSQYRQYVRRSSESGDEEGAKYYGERLDEVEAKAKKDYFSKKLASGDLKDGEFFDANFYASPESGRFKIYDSGELYRGGKSEAAKGDVTFYTPKQWYAETYDNNVVRNRNPLNTFVYNSENAFESVYYKLSDAVHSTDSYKNATKAEQRAIDDMLLKMNGGPKDFSDAVGGGKTSKQSGKGTPIPQPIQDGFRKLGIDAVEVPEWVFGGKDLGDTGIGHQTEVIVLNKDRLTGSQPIVKAEQPVEVAEENESESVRNWRERITDAEDRLREVAPQKSASDVPKMSYERRKALAQAVADKSDGEYVVLYRVQEGSPDDFRPNHTGKAGEFKALGDEESLEGAVWLTSDPEWAEGASRATAGIGKDVSPEDVNIVAIPVKKSLIDNVVYDGGDTAGKGYREKLKEKGKKIVQTRGVETDDALKQKQLYYALHGNDFTGLDSTNPNLWPKSEFILWKQDAQDVFDDGMELMLKEHNEQAGKTVNKRQARRIEGELDEANSALKAQLDDEAKAKAKSETTKVEVETPKAETETPKTTLVGEDTPNGRNIEEVPDYDFTGKSHTDILNAEVKPTMLGVKHFVGKAYDAIMQRAKTELIGQLHDKFGDVEVSDFDWVRHQSQNGVPLKKIIGSEDPTTHRIIDQNKIDAMKWWADQPLVKDLRKASRESLGKADDKNYLGYLPQTDYDPTNLSYEEALNGVGMLWEHATGKSVMKDGKYVGYGGTFEGRYGTFVKNMLWDARKNDLAAAKLIEEAQMEGKPVTPELIKDAKEAVKGERKIQKGVDDSASTKGWTKAFSTMEKSDFEKLGEESAQEGAKSGIGKAIHDVYRKIFSGANSKGVKQQVKTFAANLDQLSNNMRHIVLEGLGSLYDWGGSDILYADGSAIEIVNRYMNDGGDLRAMLTEYLEKHSHRSPEYAEAVADKWMSKLGDLKSKGKLTKGTAISSLANSMKWEAATRLRKWLVMAKYDEFNDATRKTIDSLLFNHKQTEAIKNSPKISKLMTKALDTASSMRYRALFYGNFKNALLQVSELSRLFTTFKWGDVAQMAKKMATDEGFRARVDVYTEAVTPNTRGLESALYGSYADAASKMKVEKDGVSFEGLKNATKTIDDIALAPINAAEAYKNRMMVAALVQEADRLQLTGDEALRHIRKRFERVALAADEMGKIGMASSPLARAVLFLQNFQIRELGMHYYNIKDEWMDGHKGLKGAYNVTKYLSKVLGSKLAVTLILSRLGYSATQTLGADPFGMLDSYQKMDEEDMELPDYLVKYNPIFAGGMTSLLADLYFMARKAYEDSNDDTISDDVEQHIGSSWGVSTPFNSFDEFFGSAAEDFAPGSVFFKRINQMNEMMDTGWATSASGNKMYTAPNDAFNTILGYLFGRSATANAAQYNQTYGDNLWQTLGRFVPGREWGDFDPIDTKNYSDWFKGDANDKQQFNKGIYYFKRRRDEIIDAYEEAIRKSYSTSDDTEAKNTMNSQLGELYTQLSNFVDAYQKKNGTITPAMTKQVIGILNTYRKNTNAQQENAASDASMEGYNTALERYSGLGLPEVGTYSGPTSYTPDKEVTYQGSPQWRAAKSGYYNVDDEVVNVLKLVDKNTLEPLRKEIKDAVSDAYAKKDWDALGRIQKQYLKEFDNAVGPVIAAYGNSVLNKGAVENQLETMLSSGGNSGNLIPSEQYAKNKYGKYQSMEYESVDVGKWAKKRFSGDTFTKPTVTSGSTAASDLAEIKKLIRRGSNDSARVKALQLKVRVDNQQRYLSRDDYKWLTEYLNYKETK